MRKRTTMPTARVLPFPQRTAPVAETEPVKAFNLDETMGNIAGSLYRLGLVDESGVERLTRVEP